MKHPALACMLAAAAAVALGCAPPLAVVAATEGGSATAVLDLAVAERHLLDTIEPWRKADIDHAKLTLFRGSDATPVVILNVLGAELGLRKVGRKVTFTNLHSDTRYVVEARAWADAAESTRIDALDSAPSSCTLTFTTATDDAITGGTLNLTLRDRPFAGGASGSRIVITDGTIASPPL